MAVPQTDSIPVPARLSGAQRWTLVVSCVSVALVIASMAALYGALPQIAESTGATQAQLTWVVDAYTLALACLVLSGGAVGDRYGRRIVLVAGLVIFAAGSAIPLFADRPAWVIAARAVAGVGAALVMPSTLSILTAGFPADKQGRAVGVWAGVAGSGGVIGLLGSGLLLQVFSWRAVFVALTAAATILVVAALTLTESRDRDRPPVDVAGAMSSAAAVGVFVVAVTAAPEHGWTSPLVLTTLAVALAATVVFVLTESRVPHPLLPIRLLVRRGFAAGAVSLALQFLVTFGLFYLIVQYFQLILDYSPLQSALALAPMAGPLVGISLIAPWLCERAGLKIMTATGMSVIAAGLVWLSRIDTHTTYLYLLGPVLIMSAGLGLCAAPATAAIVADTPRAKHGIAAAVNDAAREIGAAIGIAVAGSVLAAGYHHRIQPALTHLPPPARGPVSDSLAAALAVADKAGPAAQPLADFARDAFLTGTHHATLTLAGIAATGAALALTAPGPSYHPHPEDQP
ncbi:MFS transporter [Nocardia nova]|uniref:MFS transporter n=1 Tax=Nocardia nova TaxID=37330 RepID=UPI001894BD48|nr:MFS transporter [Nocardia nova]MBF6277695.1 MFS transporter [Nocardia nova]